MISAIQTILGNYVQLTGDGLASINWPWIVGAILLILSIWFVFKVCIIFFRWALGSKNV